jgi:hypothetical protein
LTKKTKFQTKPIRFTKRGTATCGKKFARDEKYHYARVVTVSTKPLDADVLTVPLPKQDKVEVPEQDEVELRRGKKAEDDEERETKPTVAPEIAKAQRSTKYTNAMQEWGTKLKRDEGMRVASGFKPKGKAVKSDVEESSKAEPWHVEEGIERGYIKGDKSRLNEALYQFFNDFNGVADAFGIRAANDESSPDHAIQIDNNGKPVFIGGMTYDRKRRSKPMEGKEKKDGEMEMASESRVRVRTMDGEGYDKTVKDKRTITSTGAVDCAGYNPARGDLLLAERITDTKHRAEEVAVFVGPLLPELRKAVFENVSATEIGESLGFVQPQASAVGNALLQRALEAAADGYDRIRERERGKLTYAEWLEKQPDGMPIPARKLKRAYDKRAKIKAGIIAEVDQAIAHVGIVKASNDNLPLTFQRKTDDAAA